VVKESYSAILKTLHESDRVPQHFQPQKHSVNLENSLKHTTKRTQSTSPEQKHFPAEVGSSLIAEAKNYLRHHRIWVCGVKKRAK
jgi:hypothetical protein